MIFGLMRLSKNIIIQGIATVYIEFFRGTSLLVQLFWVYYVLPFFGISLEAFVAGVVALGLNFGAYGAEIVGRILAVPKGQWEAAHALNFSPAKRIKRIIIPQIFPIILPPAANLTVELLKATALVALVTVVDLTFEAKQINSITWLSAQCFGTALLIYYIMARLALVPFLRWLEVLAAKKVGEETFNIMEMGFRWDFAYEILPQMLWATLNTIIAAGVGYAIALVVGLFFLLGQRTPSKIINGINREIVEFIRSTPLLIQLFFVYFVLPQFGIKLSAWVCGMITIGLHFGTYLSEVYRGALEGVSKTQWEACRALNFSTVYTYRRIVLPQAFPIAIPGMGNYLVGIFKDTPLLSTIGVAELFHAATAVGGYNYRYLEPYTMVGIIFLILSVPAAMWVRKLERKVNVAQGKMKQ